ncbi:MAG: RNA polymerase sigma-70 factor [Bacteroidia bacterium]|nr:RNA polymerase sigma-70 factor [Bacteroidia bacterium]
MQQANHNTKDLFLEISNENQNAFNALFRQQYVKLVSFAQTFVVEKNLAEEIVSDVFVSIWINRDKLPVIDNPNTYLYVSVKNRSLNILRNKTYTVAIEEQLEAQKTTHDNPHDKIEQRELSEKLLSIINALPEQQRLVFNMIKQNGLTAKQAAEILQLSPRTVETHLYKAIKQLEQEITDYLGYSPKKKRMKRMIMLVL